MIYFTHDELVPPDVAEKGPAYCFGLFQQRLLDGLDQLRDDLGFALFVNDWAVGGSRKFSGYRPQSCAIGVPGSMHKAGLAFDLHTRTDDQMNALRARVRAMGHIYGIRRMEAPDHTPGWCHVDGKEHGRPGVHVFQP